MDISKRLLLTLLNLIVSKSIECHKQRSGDDAAWESSSARSAQLVHTLLLGQSVVPATPRGISKIIVIRMVFV